MCKCFVCTLCIKYLQKPEDGFKSHEMEVIDGCVLPCGAGTHTPSPLQEYPGFLTTDP